MRTITDQETGEVLTVDPTPAGSPLEIAVSAAIGRNEKLLERQDKLLEEIDCLRSENQRLSDLYSEARAQFHRLLAEAQIEFETLKRDNQVDFTTRKGGSYQSETASMEAATKAIGNSLTSRGIALRQPVIDHPSDNGLSIVRTTLSFNGYEEHHDISIISAYARSRSNDDVKSFGADVSLVRKYALFATLGLVQETKEATSSKRDRFSNSSKDNRPARSSAPAHSAQNRATPAPATAANSASAQGSPIREHQGLRDASTTSELSAAMNAIPREERAQYTGYFNQRRMQLQDTAKAA